VTDLHQVVPGTGSSSALRPQFNLQLWQLFPGHSPSSFYCLWDKPPLSKESVKLDTVCFTPWTKTIHKPLSVHH